jgi:hypothetical protein
MRIVTGADADADAVVPQEAVRREGDLLYRRVQPRTGGNLRRRGSDLAHGTEADDRRPSPRTRAASSLPLASIGAPVGQGSGPHACSTGARPAMSVSVPPPPISRQAPVSLAVAPDLS